ncbi:flavodoxin [uncultured Oscillibacter sp.]|uniref:flavodoxin n=1 Tax=uncultured Oscillibacter sp. TaxID=876091 RepID=UPI00260C5700|nr:flavodoxin [uncultured Oscillibacter sp.]
MKTCKRIGALLLALILTCSLSVTAFASLEDTGFSDVDADDWFAESAVYVRDNGVMNGTSDTTFNPNGTTNRGQIAAILYRAAGSPAVSGAADFPDVTAGAYYADAASWAAANGIVTGYSDGTFGPGDPITRQQLAAILWRYAGSPAAESGADYADESTIASYAVTAVDWARDTGVITGRDGNVFDPNGRATRAQAAVILHRYLELLGSGAEETPETPEDSGETRVLVAYYSATGNTEEVADAIAEATGGDVFEITPADPYTSGDLDWTDENSRVVYEYENPEARDVELAQSTPADWADYDVVFIGYPIWWGIAAWPVDGFVEANDFTGKTVIPFCTSSSSGLGESGDLLAELAASGDWQEGQRFRSGASQADVTAWVESLNLA